MDPGQFPPAVSTPAVSKSRTAFFSSPRLARTRGCAGHTCGEQVARLRRARRAPCFFLPRVSHARGWFRVRAHAWLLFSRAGRKPAAHPQRTETLEKLSFAPWLFKRFPYLPAVCGPKGRVSRPAARKRGEISERAQASSFAQKRPKSWSSAPWLFGRFPYLPAVCGPKGRVSRPAARGKGRSAAGRRNGGSKGALPRPLANLCLLSFRKKVEARRGLSDK